METLEAFGLPGPRAVFLIGAGGKTTLMYALARALRAAGRTVVTTTSTRIREQEAAGAGALVLGGDASELAGRVADALARHGHVSVAASRLPAGGKLAGLSPDAIDALVGRGVADAVLVEADGAAGRPLKAHLPHEPVLARCADAVIAVIGAGAAGRPADDAHVHRSDVFRARLGLPAGAIVTPERIAAIVFHAEGWLARVPEATDVTAFVSGAGAAAGGADARAIASALHAADAKRRLRRVVVGDALAGAFEVVPRP